MEITELDRILPALRDEPVEVAVDCMFATPLLQQPLRMSADLSIQSATKFIGGRSDLMLGLVGTRDTTDQVDIRHVRAQSGGTPGAREAWLALRGLRSLPVRLDAAQRSAQLLAERLPNTRVHYAGLPGDPGHMRAKRLMSGFGAMLPIQLDSTDDQAETLCTRVEVFTYVLHRAVSRRWSSTRRTSTPACPTPSAASGSTSARPGSPTSEAARCRWGLTARAGSPPAPN
jgi:cystathionine gamma-synthase